jgi:hypothetical protein
MSSLIRPLQVLTGAMILCLAGCGTRNAEFSGQVTYNGKPIFRGSITIEGEDKKVLVAAIGDDGTFSFPSIPAGKYKVGIICPQPPAEGQPAQDALGKKRRDGGGLAVDLNAAKRWVRIPERYFEPGTSELSVEVTAPVTKKDFPLND